MPKLVFDHDRDCSDKDTVQDVLVSNVNGTLCIEQYDGTGEENYYFIALPPHMVKEFIDAVLASQIGAEPITISGLPPSSEHSS